MIMFMFMFSVATISFIAKRGALLCETGLLLTALRPVAVIAIIAGTHRACYYSVPQF